MTVTETAPRSASPQLVEGVDFILVPVQDLDRARRFYGEVLGLEPGLVWGSDKRPTVGAEFETGTVTIALMDVARVGREFRSLGAGAIVLRVDDVPARRAELEARGVQFSTDLIDSGSCHQAYFADSEGNSLGLHHRYDPRT